SFARKSGDPSPGQLPEGGEIGQPEVGAEGTVGEVRWMEVPQAPPEGLGLDVDQADLVGSPDDGVRYRLPGPHARDPLDGVVQAGEVLDVQCGDDVDALPEQL